MIIHDPGNTLRIDSVWAFVSVDEDGNEGVCAFSSPLAGGGLMPLIAADPARLDSLRPIARELAQMTKKKIRLIRLTVREDLEIIEP